MDEDKVVTIKVTKKTRKKLRDIGKKGETYDDVISAMLKELEPRMEAPYS
jgi:hypothetical protein